MPESERSQFRDWFEWRWVGIGFLLALGLNLVNFWALYPLLLDLLTRQQRVLLAAGLLAATTLAVCFLVGVVVGRLALRRAVKEPAVASVLAVLGMAILQLRLGMLNIAGAVLGAPLCFLSGYWGGKLGWRWRWRSLQRRWH